MNGQCGCESPSHGQTMFCERHKVDKTFVLWDKCQERGSFWDAWEAGHGVGQNGKSENKVASAKKAGCNKKRPIRILMSDLEKERRAICETCANNIEHNRCKLIDLGCSTEFRKTLKDPEGVCPEGHWEAKRPVSAWLCPSITTMHMIYHVYPSRKNDVWIKNLKQLKRRLHIFSGKQVVVVATDKNTSGVDKVRGLLDWERIKYIEMPNDRKLREVATFKRLLEEIQSTGENEATFYAHTKGNSTPGNHLAVEYWRNAMYHHLLDHCEVARDLLWTHSCVGTCKWRWPDSHKPFPTEMNNKYRWMYSGTFFWFRNRDVFGHPDWDKIVMDRYGAEGWLGGLFPAEQAATVFQPWQVTDYLKVSPYDPMSYLWPIRDMP